MSNIYLGNPSEKYRKFIEKKYTDDKFCIVALDGILSVSISNKGTNHFSYSINGHEWDPLPDDGRISSYDRLYLRAGYESDSDEYTPVLSSGTSHLTIKPK